MMNVIVDKYLVSVIVLFIDQVDLKYSLILHEKKSTIGNVSYTVTNDKHPETKCKVVCISGCRDTGTSADAIIQGKPCGALTWALLSILRNHKYSAPCVELLYEIRHKLHSNGYSQVPMISFGRKEDIDSIFLE
jgi:hypothetical protein